MRLAIVLLLACLAGCTRSQRRTFACDHCACSPASRDATHPISCEILPVEHYLQCCIADGS